MAMVSLPRSWQDHGKVMARSWQDLGKASKELAMDLGKGTMASNTGLDHDLLFFHKVCLKKTAKDWPESRGLRLITFEVSLSSFWLRSTGMSVLDAKVRLFFVDI